VENKSSYTTSDWGVTEPVDMLRHGWNVGECNPEINPFRFLVSTLATSFHPGVLDLAQILDGQTHEHATMDYEEKLDFLKQLNSSHERGAL